MRTKIQPSIKTVRAALRGSVAHGRLEGARIKVTSTKQNQGSVGGYTQYAEKGEQVSEICAPISDDAFGIAIKGHESAHATHHGKRPRRKPMTANEAIASQIVDDVNIEDIRLPDGLSESMVKGVMDTYRRSKLTVAMVDVRQIARVNRAICKGKMPNSVGARNGNLLAAVRSVAMLQHYGQRYDYKLPVTSRTATSAAEGLRVIGQEMGSSTLGVIREVIRKAKNRRSRARAISMLVALMETELPEGEERHPFSERDGDLLAPVLDGDALNGHMMMRDLLPKSAFCAKEKRQTRRYSPSGVILNPARYLNAIVSNDANGLFSRRVKEKAGGCVLIDASGSMGATAKNLTELCALVPTATVAYYSGSAKGRGELVIYAYNGKRYSGELPENTLHGGNSVDLPAIRWMFKRGRPWTLISDLEFCGGVTGSEIIAHALVERATMRKELTVHRSLDAAFEAFGGKGRLRN